MDNTSYLLNLETNEFREMTDDEKGGQDFVGQVIPKGNVALMNNEDIEAIVVYYMNNWKDEREKHIGIIQDGILLISSKFDSRMWHSIYGLLKNN